MLLVYLRSKSIKECYCPKLQESVYHVLEKM